VVVAGLGLVQFRREAADVLLDGALADPETTGDARSERPSELGRIVMASIVD
jgi:hypothetical protein